MTVKELKEKLHEYDDDLRVFVDGYESGADDIHRFIGANFVINIMINDINLAIMKY